MKAVSKLLEDVKSGKTVGVALVALHRGTGYSADILGCVHDHPLLTIGLCRELEEAVRQQTRRK